MSVIKFGTWQALNGTEVANSTDPVGDGGLVLIKSQDIGIGVSSVTLTEVFSSSYENYRIVGLIQDASTNSSIRWSSPQETGAYYDYVGYYLDVFQVPTAANYFGQLTQTSAQCGFYTSNSTGDGGAFSMDIFGPYDSTKQTKYFSTSITYYAHSIWGRITNVYTSLTDITFIANAGTFQGGTIRVYGYRN